MVDTRKQIAYPPHKLKRVVKLLTVLRTGCEPECDVQRQLPTKDSVLPPFQHRSSQLRKARAHERRNYRVCHSRSLSEARRSAHRFPGMNLLGASTRQERRCSAPFGVPQIRLCIDQKRKKNCSRDLDPELYFFPSPIFPRKRQERQKNRARGSSKFLSAAFYPTLPIQSFVRRECSRVTRFSTEVADETRRERHVSLAREG